MHYLEHKNENFRLSFSSCLTQVTILFILTRGTIRPGNWGWVRRGARCWGPRVTKMVIAEWTLNPSSARILEGLLKWAGGREKLGVRRGLLETDLWKGNSYQQGQGQGCGCVRNIVSLLCSQVFWRWPGCEKEKLNLQLPRTFKMYFLIGTRFQTEISLLLLTQLLDVYRCQWHAVFDRPASEVSAE